MKFWAVSTKYFDSGRVKVNIYPVEAETKPESGMTENKMCDHYIDYFDTYERPPREAGGGQNPVSYRNREQTVRRRT